MNVLARLNPSPILVCGSSFHVRDFKSNTWPAVKERTALNRFSSVSAKCLTSLICMFSTLDLPSQKWFPAQTQHWKPQPATIGTSMKWPPHSLLFVVRWLPENGQRLSRLVAIAWHREITFCITFSWASESHTIDGLTDSKIKVDCMCWSIPKNQVLVGGLNLQNIGRWGYSCSETTNQGALTKSNQLPSTCLSFLRHQ
jgi:hypothetical protein